MNIVIIGAGRVGRYLIERLHVEDHDITVIDQDEHILEELASSCDIQTVLGNGCSIEILKLAGIGKADIVITATDSDEVNLLAGVLAEGVNPTARKLSRIKSLETDANSLPTDISVVFDQFINPSEEAASHLLRLCEVPGAAEVVDFVGGMVRVIGVTVPSKASIVGQKLFELPTMGEELPSMLVVAIEREGQLIIPQGKDHIDAGDMLYIASEPGNTDLILQSLGLDRRAVRNVMISGSSDVARILAKKLVKQDVKVKLIEPDSELCEVLANELNDVLILNGDATDQDLLEQEAIDDVDVFVGAADHDEDNILSSLLAKRMGARYAAAVVDKRSYLGFVSKLGVDIVVSPNLTAASSIIKYVRRGVVSSVFSIRDDSAEVLEIIATKNSKIIGSPLKDVVLPQGVIIAAVVKEDKVCIPSGETVIQEKDRVVVFARKKSLPQLEKMVEAKFSLFG